MVKIRLRRMGSRNHPFYRVVVSDARNTPTASALEEIGHYDPRRQPAVVEIDRERLESWVARGARLSPTVEKLLRQRPAAAPASAPVAAPASVPASVPAAPPPAAPPPAAADNGA